MPILHALQAKQGYRPRRPLTLRLRRLASKSLPYAIIVASTSGRQGTTADITVVTNKTLSEQQRNIHYNIIPGKKQQIAYKQHLLRPGYEFRPTATEHFNYSCSARTNASSTVATQTFIKRQRLRHPLKMRLVLESGEVENPVTIRDCKSHVR